MTRSPTPDPGGPAIEAVRDGSGAMFDAIAARYDLLNRVLSFGLDRRWRRRAAGCLALSGAARVLDVATGTADLAIAIARALPGAEVVGVDPSERMLELGREKLRARGLDARVVLERGTIEVLPFSDSIFDAATIAFGIRNVVDRLRGLSEMARVVKRGGHVLVLELGEPEDGPLRSLARLHVRRVVPLVGGLLSGAAEYHYLQRSIAAFPRRAEFAELMRRAGLEVERVEPLTLGVASLFVACAP